MILIQFIEFIEFRNIDKNESDPLKKIIDMIPVDNLFVKTDYGIVPVEEITRTIPLPMFYLKLENGYHLECADTHIVYTKGHIEKFVYELTTDDYIITDVGDIKVKSIKKSKVKSSMYDLTINGPIPSYYTNNILSHNTVSASIVMLHFCLFNNDKGIMIVANKSNTVKEIVRKIKDIYKPLPFWMKKGVLNWNETALSFDNGCRIQSEGRTKEPSIGFTVDFLYLDEFAKVPNNIIEPYYGAVVPTVSSIKNSKIIITSTPDGFNMFHKLLTDAERDDDDPLKNPYTPMRVYWHEVAGRKNTRVFPLAYKMKEYGITEEMLHEEFLKLKYNTWKEDHNGKNYIMIENIDDVDETYISFIRNIRVNKIPLQEICIITNWKEEETKLIGGETMFAQEYDCQFVTGDKLLFDAEQLNKFKNSTTEFVYEEFDILNDRIQLPYNKLKWIKGRPDLFNKEELKKYYICASIDLCEGLGGDYTVLNIFRLMPKPIDIIEKTHDKLKNVYEYFNIEQIGIFRANNWSLEEFAELFYCIMFELFDSEKCKVVLEYNKYGGEFLSYLPYVFEENNNYSNGIFLRYKHRKDDPASKIGLKVTVGENESSKKILVKSFQDSVKKSLMKLHNDVNINELSMFIKKETASGNFTYKAESGHDDCLLPDTFIKTIYGYKKIKDIELGDMCLTHLGNYKKVTNICIRNFDGDMYKVKFKGQSQLDLTYNHPIYTQTYSSNKKIFDKKDWVLPGDIENKRHKSISIIDKYDNNKNNVIKYTDLFEKNLYCAESNIKLKDIKLDKKFAKFLGLFLADGNCYKPNDTTYRISISFNKNQTDLINEMKEYFIGLELNINESYQNINGYTLTTYNKTLFELLIKCYDQETKEKILPDFANNLGKDLKYVLEYWLKGDGWFCKGRGNRKDCNIGCSTSLQLALSMRDISISLNKHTLISKHKRKRYDVICKDQYWVSIYDEKPKNTSLHKISNLEISSNLDNIEKYHYSGITYNLEVEDDNSYIANGIVVHNCVMTLVNLSSIFNHTHYKSLVETLLQELVGDIKTSINKYAFDDTKNKSDVGLAPFGSNYKRIYNTNTQKVYNDTSRTFSNNSYTNRRIK
ncbi:terminase family protein [bacterium]|nr:terminase family protein [bacterium]